ncbi:hypothetical protein JVT61DRAFT_8845 [Boletus reticuloceps]|uniref:Uncharacterized protein n=1 Tax=Boletus reticuloceps TaxID=495285 RepID=A0A8I2YI95_9AGAM|nr:hypothetical protein JVT61DRAFT_8845 [Boletus reticuloceps]
MAHQMTELYIVDASLREWIMPNFTTTTTIDKSISAIVMIGTMKEYFLYKFRLLCGIPRVTLEGERSDWEEILCCLEKCGIQTTTWYPLLRPIVSRFVAAYDDPNSPGNLDFWNKVAHRSGSGSGPRWLSRWITAFCVFGEKGQWQGKKLAEERHGDVKKANDPSQFSAEEFASTYIRSDGTKPYLVLDGFPYPRIDFNAGYAYVDVKLDDNRKLFDVMFVAGLAGMQI